MPQPSDIIVFLLIGYAIYLWWYTQGLWHIALHTCKTHCKQHNLQLLDETVALSRLWFKRNSQGRLKWNSKYVFEFTTSGADRYKGQLELLGEKVENISLGPYQTW